jgi:hypothetical protein
MKHIFVVGLDDFHLAQLRTLPDAEQYLFHPLFTYREIKQQDRFPVAWLIDEGARKLQAFPDRVSAVVGYWDFPVSTTLPILRRSVGLPGPSLESVLKCEHKYWSRLLQRQVVPENVPDFCAVDPFSPDPLGQVTIAFPFWLKPVKSVLSHLGFRINDPSDFKDAIRRIRAEIYRYAEPFNLILKRAELPSEIVPIDGFHCVAETLISGGSQCTQEGYVFGGAVNVYGTVDSLRCGPAQSSFSRYQYPSDLPESVRHRMAEICRRFIQHIGYDTAPFNIEFFWEAAKDRIWLLEINPRISKSHAPLFHMVDGIYHHQVMVDLGLGRCPQFSPGGGQHPLAAKFMVRAFADARVTRVPTAAEISSVEQEVPGTRILVEVREGMLLSEMRDQDSYSYELATIFVGADNHAELESRFHACMARLPLHHEELPKA